MSNAPLNNGRRRFLTATTAVVGGLGAVAVAVPFIKSWNPSAKAKAAGAPVEVDISKIEPGQLVRVEWQGKPVWIVRRTQSVLDNLKRSVISFVIHNLKWNSSQSTLRMSFARLKKSTLLPLVSVLTLVVHLLIYQTLSQSRCRA